MEKERVANEKVKQEQSRQEQLSTVKIKQKKIEKTKKVREIGGRKGPEPTRYGDWEKNGRCIDF